jgi:ubiquinone/menaquinone biosynthesis C-methylase UbiE
MASKSIYTTDHAESVLSTHRWRTLSNSAQFIRPYLKPGMKVLDVGCGPGSLTVDIAKHIQPGGHVTGVENVPDPLQEARKLAEQEGVDVTFEVADAVHLPYADDSFDLVFAHQVLQHVAQPVEMLKEMRRVARTGSGGVVACRESTVPVSVIVVFTCNDLQPKRQLRS